MPAGAGGVLAAGGAHYLPCAGTRGLFVTNRSWRLIPALRLNADEGLRRNRRGIFVGRWGGGAVAQKSTPCTTMVMDTAGGGRWKTRSAQSGIILKSDEAATVFGGTSPEPRLLVCMARKQQVIGPPQP